MNNNDICNIFASTRLFQNALPETLEFAIKNTKILECNKGKPLFDNHTDYPALYIILKGEASVTGISKHKPVILNTLTKGKVFGMASLFGEKCSSTSVIAKEECIYAVLSQETVEKMLGLDVCFAKNYVCFLSDKIRFLNKKIAFFTTENTEKKVAGYILSLPFNEESHIVTLDINMSKLAQNLDISRASLYRAFDSLEEKLYIKKQNNVIHITSYDEFKKIYGEQL